MGERSRSPSSERLLLVPSHVKRESSLLSVECLSDSDEELKSRSSGLELDFDTPLSSPGEDTDSGTQLCSATIVDLKDYIGDLTLLSHAALLGDVDVDAANEKESLSRRQPQAEVDSSGAESSTYDKWKRLSGPLILFMVLGLIILVWGRTHLLQLLQWLEDLPFYMSLVVFIALFTLISFPFGFGYIILNMMAGYLYGFLHGQLIVMISVAVGAMVSFLACRSCFRDYSRGMVTSNALQAVLKVVEGPHGFKVIFLTRFTPIPFGLQNVLFSMTGVSCWQFFLASVAGLLPTQILNTYMGSTVRSMQEVLTDRMDGYVILGVQVIFSLVLMVYLLNKARRELAKLTRKGEGEP